MIYILLLISISVVLSLIFWIIGIFRKNSLIQSINQGQNVISTWVYTPDEWKSAAENHFGFKVKFGESGKVSFTPHNILVTNGKRNILWELVGSNKYSTHLTDVYLLKEPPTSTIRFQVRTKVVKKDRYGRDTMDETCDFEEFYVPVPKDYPLEVNKVVGVYRDYLDKNADAVAAAMPFGFIWEVIR